MDVFAFQQDGTTKQIAASSPHRMVIGDTKEELIDYINDNQLIGDFEY
jgi:hypothetical protein